MKKCALLMGLLLLLTGVSVSASEKHTIAVLRFENNSLMDRKKYNGLKKGLCDMLVTELSKISAFHVLEREKLEGVLSELELGQSDVIDAASAPQIGKLLGASHLMFGGFVKDMGKKIRIDVRIVNVTSGEVVKAVESTGKAKDLFKLVKKISYKIADELDVEITKKEKKLIKGKDKVGMEALMIYADGLEQLDAGNKAEALKHFKAALKKDKKFDRAKAQIKKLEAEE